MNKGAVKPNFPRGVVYVCEQLQHTHAVVSSSLSSRIVGAHFAGALRRKWNVFDKTQFKALPAAAVADAHCKAAPKIHCFANRYNRLKPGLSISGMTTAEQQLSLRPLINVLATQCQ